MIIFFGDLNVNQLHLVLSAQWINSCKRPTVFFTALGFGCSYTSISFLSLHQHLNAENGLWLSRDCSLAFYLYSPMSQNTNVPQGASQSVEQIVNSHKKIKTLMGKMEKSQEKQQRKGSFFNKEREREEDNMNIRVREWDEVSWGTKI